MRLSLSELIDQATEADRPTIPLSKGMPTLGGVDPLGLRQINFDLMDAVLPGLNNVGRRVRPYVVVAWAARQATRLVEASGKTGESDRLIRDFIDRIEVLFAWSQFLKTPNAQLPGRRVLKPFVEADRYVFHGKKWESFKDNRRGSTAFTAAITYGPSIKALKWAGPVTGADHAWAASGLFDDALDAFEAVFEAELDHPAFSVLGKVSVERADVKRWADLWDMNELTEEEQTAFADALCGGLADDQRRETVTLLQILSEEEPEAEIDDLRASMAEVVEDATPTRRAWRRLQVRQAFRYALEAWFYWCLARLNPHTKSTAQLVELFREKAGGWAASDKPGVWLKAPAQNCPVAFMAEIDSAMNAGSKLPKAICRTLAFCLNEIDADERSRGRPDRLPLWRARAEAQAWRTSSPAEFISHMMETWLFAQHAYWSSSRSLADARAGGKIILRLRVTLDEGGWRLTQLGGIGSQPYPTPDRLETAWRLARECDVL